MTNGVEIEVKLAVVEPESLRLLLDDPAPARLAGFRSLGPSDDVEVLDRYIDTAGKALELAGIRARLRSSADGVTVTVKRSGVDDGLVVARREVEGPAEDDNDPRGWPDSEARQELLAASAGQALVETARLRQHRLVIRLVRDGSTVELSLDHLEALDGNVVVGSRWELEAELKEGDREDLRDLAEALERVPGVGAPVGSKRSFAIGAVAAARSVATLGR